MTLKKFTIIFLLLLIPFSVSANFTLFTWKIDNKINEKLFPNKHKYNSAVDLYKEGYPSFALDVFSSLDCSEVSKFCSQVKYNIARANYDTVKDLKWEDKIKWLKESLAYFENSLLYNPKARDTQTEQNIEIIKELIKEEEKKEEERRQKDKEKDEQNKQNQKWESSKEETNRREKGQDYSKDSNIDKELTENKRNYIEDKAKWLRNQEEANQKYFGKKEDNSWNEFGMEFYRLFWKVPANPFTQKEKRDW